MGRADRSLARRDDRDLTRKSTIYSEAGFAAYRPVTREGSTPTPGLGSVGTGPACFHPSGAQPAVPYAPEVTLAVDDLLATPEG